MFGAPFPGVSPVKATLINAVNSSLSGTFPVQTGKLLILLCFAAQTSPLSQITSAVIGGHAATQIVSNGAVVNTCSMWAAMVDPSDPNTWSVSGISVNAGRCSAFIYAVTASRINATASAASINTTNPNATLNVADFSTFVGCAKAQGATPPTATWAGLNLDNTQSFSQQTMTCAHADYLVAASSQTASCGFSPSTGAAGVFAVFSP